MQHEGFMLYVIFGSVTLLMFIYAIWCARWVYRNDHGKTPAKGKKGKKKKAPAKAPPKSTALVKRDDARADQTPAAKESGPDD